jgi:CheY-like chemotaxis protein
MWHEQGFQYFKADIHLLRFAAQGQAIPSAIPHPRLRRQCNTISQHHSELGLVASLLLDCSFGTDDGCDVLRRLRQNRNLRSPIVQVVLLCPASQLRAAGNRTGINLVRRSVFEKPMEIGGWSVLAAQL